MNKAQTTPWFRESQYPLVPTFLALGYLLLSIGGTGCTPSNVKEMDARLAKLERAIALPATPGPYLDLQSNPVFTNLGLAVTDLASRLAKHEQEINRLTNAQATTAQTLWDITWERMKADNSSIILDVGASGYSIIDAQPWQLLVKPEDFVPYLDGYRVKLLIGNPYNVSFSGFKINATWHKPYTVVDGKLVTVPPKTNSISLTDTLHPATWNKVEFNISPATLEEIKNLTIRIELAQLQLGNQRKP